ncbi:MAG: hypothetical protein HW386_2449 [Gammaproteobacteria bacterium]|nr:hypothetical protein [Gammaproteobacteria bacterium]
MALNDMGNMIRIAVIGHTNAGKTSLLRTLTRDRNFGIVSIHPATTRNVEAVRVELTNELTIEFHDTPGFEDSIGLLNTLHELYPDPRIPGPQRLTEFLDSGAARSDFAQEAKALRQLLSCDLSLYVADASEEVSGKYADEFVILNWSGKPCLVVLNFVAGAAHTKAWREALRNAGLHNVVEFDTVVFNIRDEQRLLQQTALLLPVAEGHIQQLLALRGEERVQQLEAAAVLIAETLIECALVHAGGSNPMPLVQEQVRKREQRLNRDLLGLFRFSEADYAPDELPIQGAQWSLDLFDGEVLASLGLSLGSSAAKGAAAGAAVDLVTGFTSLGLATIIGGAIGAGIDGVNRIRQYFTSRPDAIETTQVAMESLSYLARRACLLVRDLASRGHAAVQPLLSQKNLADRLLNEQHIVDILQQSRYQPHWASARSDSNQIRRRQELVTLIRHNLPQE